MAKYSYDPHFEGTFWTVFDGDFYVSTIGSDVTGDGSPKKPFLTVKRAFDLALNNEKIVVGPDQYVTYVPSANAPSGAWLPCRVATTGQQNLSAGLDTVDGITLQEEDCVLVWQQTDSTENGIYVVTSGDWVRADIFDTSSDALSGKLVPIAEGSLHGKTIFQHLTTGAIDLGSTSIVFEKAAVTDWGQIQGNIQNQQDLIDEFNLKADKNNVLELDNTAAYAPTDDYHPATKKFLEDVIAVLDKATPKGLIDCSTNPVYPAGSIGDYYYVSAAGKIGGASGIDVQQFDKIQCIAANSGGNAADANPGGTPATIEECWMIIQGNLDKATTTGMQGHTDDEKYVTASKSFDGWSYWVENEDISALGTASKKIVGAINEISTQIGTLNNITNLEDSTSNVVNSASGTGYLQWGNIRLEGNKLSSIDPNGDITLDPEGMGNVVVNIGAGGDFKFRGLHMPSSLTIAPDTIDSGDSQGLYLSGGGTNSVGRGAYIQLSGNEQSTSNGKIHLFQGNISGASTNFYFGATQLAATMNDSGTWDYQGNIIKKASANIISKTSAFTLTAEENGSIIECSGTFTITIATGLPNGFNVQIVNKGTGTITIASNGTLESDGTLLETQHSGAFVYHSSGNVHTAIGKLT
ncbi:MAG: hypothetical protein ABJN36_12410 [Cyclobacteriaceae bacterium]